MRERRKGKYVEKCSHLKFCVFFFNLIFKAFGISLPEIPANLRNHKKNISNNAEIFLKNTDKGVSKERKSTTKTVSVPE